MERKFKKKRIFLAVKFPARIRKTLRQAEEILRQELGKKKVRWVSPSSLHLTIFFIGWVNEKILPRLKKILVSLASQQKVFHLYLKDFGAFPNLKKPRVLWISVGGQTKELENLVFNIQRIMKKLGFFPDHPFLAHITLARVKAPINISSRAIEKINWLLAEKREFPVKEFVLLESELTPKGAIYTPLIKFSFSRRSG